MSCQNEWKLVVQENLPRCCLKHVMEIKANIIAVDVGIKPSFLFDFAIVFAGDMAKFMEVLYRKGLTSNYLDVILIEDHVLVTRFPLLLDHLHESLNKSILIDISENLEVPKIMTESDRQLLTALCLDAIKSAENVENMQYRVVNVSKSSNISAFFGLLLGYPVIYWFSNDKMDARNCLEMVPIRVIRVFCVAHGQQCKVVSKPTQIFSWSYPDVLSTQCKDFVSEWEKTLKMTASPNQRSIGNLLFKEEVVTLPVVVM